MIKPTSVYRLSYLARTIDPSYRSNVVAILGSVAAGLLFGFYNLVAAAPLATTWLPAAVGAFLAWAIARELDPDQTVAATAAIVASITISLVATPSLLPGTGLLVASRLISGTVGVPMRPSDPFVLIGLGWLLGTGTTSPAAVPALVIGVIVCGNRSTGAILVAAGVAAASAIAMIVNQPLVGSSDPEGWSILFLVVAVVALAATIPANQPASESDVGHKELLGWRVSASRVAAAATIGAAFAIGGDAGTKDIYATVGAALVGVALARVVVRFRSPG